MELVLVIAVVWILVLPAFTVIALSCASALIRRRSATPLDRGAVVVPLRSSVGARGRRVA